MSAYTAGSAQTRTYKEPQCAPERSAGADRGLFMEGMVAPPCEGTLDMPCEAAEAGLRHLLDLAFLGQEKIWGA